MFDSMHTCDGRKGGGRVWGSVRYLRAARLIWREFRISGEYPTENAGLYLTLGGKGAQRNDQSFCETPTCFMVTITQTWSV